LRMLLHLEFPLEPFNSMVKDGSVGPKMMKILETLKPESAYFSESDGCRGGTLVVDVKEPSDVPFFAEPWFLTFNASVKFRIAMSPQDLGKSNLESLAKMWS
jgi:hypothetical protein